MESVCFLFLGVLCIYLYAFCEPFKQGFWTHDDAIRYPLLPLTVNLTSVLLIAFVCPSAVIVLTERFIYRRSPHVVWKRFSFTTLTNIVVLLFFKFAVGRLRPHFLAACRPVVDMSGDRFISSSEYECDPISKRLESNARQSFYSGHASLATGAAVFLVLYVQDAFSSSLIRSVSQVAALLLGFYPGITQVNNYWHHWSDVATGYIAGAAVAAAGYYTV